MAKFLIAVWPIPGHYHPCLAVAKALRARGHEIAFFTGSRAGKAIECEGFRRHPFNRTGERLFDSIFYQPQPPRPWWKPELLVRRERYTALLVGMLDGQVADMESVVRAWRPDAILCDPTLWGPILVTQELHRIPLAVFAFVPFCPLPGPAVPPVGPGLPRPRGLLDRVWNQLIGLKFAWGTTGIRAEANRVRVAYGLPALDGSVADLARRMPLYLVTGTREFDYGRTDLPDTVHYVGSCHFHRTKDGPPADWLRELSPDRPLVYVSEGTVNTQKPIVLAAAAEGLAELPCDVLLETSSHRLPGDMGLPSLAANMRLEPWTNVYYDEVLPRARAVVTNAGGGIVVACLRAGVPLIMIPGEWDKPEIAQRVVEAGAGLRLSASQCTPRRLRAAVEKVLQNPSFRRNAERLGASFERHRGPEDAADLLEYLVGGGMAGQAAANPRAGDFA